MWTLSFTFELLDQIVWTLIFMEISLLSFHTCFCFTDKSCSMMDPKQSCPDVLSKVPTNVIDEILMRLPFRDAVCTSILSKEWRKHWCRLPQLTLDSDLWKPKKDIQYLTGDKRATKLRTLRVTLQRLSTTLSPVIQDQLQSLPFAFSIGKATLLLTTYYISSLETESNILFLDFRDNSNCRLHFSHVWIWGICFSKTVYYFHHQTSKDLIG